MEHEAPLRAGYSRGREVHGILPLAFEAFAERVRALAARRLERCGAAATPARVGEVLARAALPDLYLAVACDEGVPGAWEAFLAGPGGRIAALAVRRGASAAEAEELARELPGDLVAPPPSGGARTRMGTYDGTGSLVAWLGAIVDRRMTDRRRAAGARVRPAAGGDEGEGEETAEPEGREADPAALAADAETARRFEEALREGWAALTDQEALGLRLRYRDELPQNAMARVLGVGEPRVSRLLRGAEEKLRAAVARRLRSDAGPGEDPERLWALLRSAVADRVASSGREPVPVPGEIPRHG